MSDKMEFGGYLPLELRRGAGYFHDLPEGAVSAYNSGRTAIHAAILSLRPKRLWVPYFYCPSVWEMLRQEDVELVPYYLNGDLLPDSIRPEKTDAVLLVNYYGILDEQVCAFAENLPRVILDHAQAFFCPPVLRSGVMNVYSCRKFVGVSDGAYLVGVDQEALALERDVSSERCGFLMRSMELGTNAAYMESLANEETLGDRRCGMSVLTQRILEGADYTFIRERRRENFRYLHGRLQGKQRLAIDGAEHAAYCYPLLLSRDVRSLAIREKLYVPTLWKELIHPDFAGKIEYDLSKNTLCLPIDQRYDINNMEQLCEIIDRILEERKNG